MFGLEVQVWFGSAGLILMFRLGFEVHGGVGKIWVGSSGSDLQGQKLRLEVQGWTKTDVQGWRFRVGGSGVGGSGVGSSGLEHQNWNFRV